MTGTLAWANGTVSLISGQNTIDGKPELTIANDLLFGSSAGFGGVAGDPLVGSVGFGGEAFAILLPETGSKGAMVVADQLRDKIGKKRLILGHGEKKDLGHVTISVGVTEIVNDDIIENIIERADKALYQAKADGRNRVVGSKSLAQ